jgi:alginate O-acetyltransferase complex protein AlgI
LLFNSYPFVLGFLPVLFIAYALVSESRWSALTPWVFIGASLFFYAYWNWIFLPLFLSSVAFNYLWGLLLNDRASDADVRAVARRKTILGIGIAANVGLLFYFKYRDFFVGSLDAVFGAHWMLLHMALPLAISFFTFEQITYLVSCYRREEGTHDFLSYAMFITFFPHLIAGPIVRYREIYPQFNRNSAFRLSAANITPGLMIFAIGLFKKVILADTFRNYVEPIYDGRFHAATSFPDAWGASMSFGLQVYFDFSGYSDMAIGLARMFNVRFPENFNSPFQSTSIIDFWRRWHMTLSYFLRDYVYIPLGGNRCAEWRRNLNLFLTMLIGGLWHGAAWTFVVWGALHGGALSFNHAWRKRGISLPALPCWAITFITVTLGWAFFRANTFGKAWDLVRGMVGLNGFAFNAQLESIGSHQYMRILIGLVIILLCPNRQTIMEWDLGNDYIYAGVFAALTTVCLLSMANPPAFVYFQF